MLLVRHILAVIVVWAISTQTALAWRCIPRTDKLTDKVDVTAMLRSDNAEEFKFPYGGGSSFILGLHENGRVLFMSLSRGQLDCGRNCSFQMRIDEAEPITVKPDSASTRGMTIFDRDLITRITSAQKLRIRVPVYENGFPVFIFTLSGPPDCWAKKEQEGG